VTTVLACALLLSLCGVAGAVDGPEGVGGFVLGDDIDRYKDTADLMSVLPIRYAEYLREVVIKDIPGFKTGQIYYGVCENPGKILRIRLKYADGSKDFFEELLTRVKDRFGDPTEWRGDPFGVVIAWKWSLKTKSGRQVSMILQYNSMDDEESKGNTIKLALTEEMQKERACYLKSHPDSVDNPDGRPAGGTPQRGDWQALVPR
jgi:hypothetical protein